MSVPKRSQAFPERAGTPPSPAFPNVPPLKGGGNVGNGYRDGAGGTPGFCHVAPDLVPMPGVLRRGRHVGLSYAFALCAVWLAWLA